APGVVLGTGAARATRLSVGGGQPRNADLRRGESDPQPRSALGPADHALPSRLPARSAARAVLVPQAPPHLPPRRAGVRVPAPLHAGHDPPPARLLADSNRRRGRG